MPELFGTVVNVFTLLEFAFLEVYVVVLKINALISLPTPISFLEGRGWRRIRIGAAEMYRALLRISAGNEGQKHQDSRDPLQLH